MRFNTYSSEKRRRVLNEKKLRHRCIDPLVFMPQVHILQIRKICLYVLILRGENFVINLFHKTLFLKLHNFKKILLICESSKKSIKRKEIKNSSYKFVS